MSEENEIDHVCIQCRGYAPEQQVCPYDSEINNNYEKIWLCDVCAEENAWDI